LDCADEFTDRLRTLIAAPMIKASHDSADSSVINEKQRADANRCGPREQQFGGIFPVHNTARSNDRDACVSGDTAVHLVNNPHGDWVNGGTRQSSASARQPCATRPYIDGERGHRVAKGQSLSARIDGRCAGRKRVRKVRRQLHEQLAALDCRAHCSED
jgi:hypothetical protein